MSRVARLRALLVPARSPHPATLARPARRSTTPRAGAAAARDPYWEDMKAGIIQAGVVVLLIGMMRWREVEPDSKVNYVMGLILFVLALRSAFLFPRRLPLFLAGYLPFNLMFPFKIPGVPAGNMTNLLLVLNLIAWASSKRLRTDRMKFGPFEYLLMAYLSVGLLAHLRASIFEGGTTPIDFVLDYKVWAGPMLVFFMIRAVLQHRQDLMALFAVILISVTIVGMVTIWEGRENSRGSIEKSRVGGIFRQSNTLGAFLAYYGAGLFAVVLRHPDTRLRAASLVGFLIIAKAATYTFSRGAYLSIGGAAFAMYFLRNPLYLALSCAAYVGAAAVIPGLVPQSIMDRIAQTQSGHDELDDDATARLDQSAMERIMLWRAADKMIRDHPVMGVGLGRFGHNIVFYHEMDLVAMKERGEHAPTDAHNAYLLDGGEFGVPGVLLMIAVLLTCLWRAFRLYFRCKHPFDRSVALAFLGGTLAVIASSMFGSRFRDEALIGNWFVLAAMSVWLQANLERETRARQAEARTRALSGTTSAAAPGSLSPASAASLVPVPIAAGSGAGDAGPPTRPAPRPGPATRPVGLESRVYRRR